MKVSIPNHIGPKLQAGKYFFVEIPVKVYRFKLNVTMICTSTMGEENRGGLPDLDLKSRSGCTFISCKRSPNIRCTAAPDLE